MLQAMFKDGTALTYLEALETEEYYEGAPRRTLTLTCAADAMGVNALNEIVSDEANTDELVLQNDAPEVQSVYSGYVLKLSVGLVRVQTQAQTTEQAAQYEDRLVCKLGRRTYIEAQLARLGLAL